MLLNAPGNLHPPLFCAQSAVLGRSSGKVVHQEGQVHCRTGVDPKVRALDAKRLVRVVKRSQSFNDDLA